MAVKDDAIDAGRTTRFRGRLGKLLVVALIAAPLLATTSCASGASTAKTAKPTKAAIERTCTSVSDALADGPDPDVDPVGYALAQIRPLRAINTSDMALQKDITALDAAYQKVYATKDKKGTQTAVNKAGKALDTICPGTF